MKIFVTLFIINVLIDIYLFYRWFSKKQNEINNLKTKKKIFKIKKNYKGKMNEKISSNKSDMSILFDKYGGRRNNK